MTTTEEILQRLDVLEQQVVELNTLLASLMAAPDVPDEEPQESKRARRKREREEAEAARAEEDEAEGRNQ